MSIIASFQADLDSLNTVSGSSKTAAVGFGFEDFSGCDAGELVKLALQANDVRQRAESYLSAVLVRLGELEGDDAVMSVCKQFDLPSYKTRRHVRTVKGLSSLPDVMRATKDGWITQDHAELLAASHRRAPMSIEEQLDLLALGVRQDCDEFKNTVLKLETQHLAAQGLNPATTNTTSAGTTVEPQPQQTTIILTADYDTIVGQLQNASLIDGTPISIDEIRRLACQANILPAIFNNKAQPLYLGRSRRKHTKAQLQALHKRDKRCTSCGIRASNCEVHHKTPWEHGGTTDIGNLTLLYPKCHHQTHKHTHPNYHNP